MCSILFDSVFILKCHITYITCLLGRLYQNISPSVTRKPWCVTSPSAFGIGWHNPPGLSSASSDITCQGFLSPRGWYSDMSPSKPCDICIKSAPQWQESPGALCHPLPSASGDITSQGFRVISGLIFWNVSLEAMWYLYKISHSVTRKPWRTMSPSAFGIRWHNAPGLPCHLGADILVCLPWSHVIYA